MNPTEMEAVLDRLERLGDPAVREAARALVRQLLRLHGDALARLLEIARQSPAAAALFDAWKDEPRVCDLLLLHGLHPDDLTARVRQAVSGVEPVAAFLGVGVRVVGVSEAAVRCELTADDVPPAALAELKERIEVAITSRAPEVQAVQFTGGPRRVALPLVGSRPGERA